MACVAVAVDQLHSKGSACAELWLFSGLACNLNVVVGDIFRIAECTSSCVPRT